MLSGNYFNTSMNVDINTDYSCLLGEGRSDVEPLSVITTDIVLNIWSDSGVSFSLVTSEPDKRADAFISTCGTRQRLTFKLC